MSDVAAAAVYDPQPPGSNSGPIRFVTAAADVRSIVQMGHPCVVLEGDGRDIGYATHYVVDGVVTPLNGATPAPLTIVPPPPTPGA